MTCLDGGSSSDRTHTQTGKGSHCRLPPVSLCLGSQVLRMQCSHSKVVSPPDPRHHHTSTVSRIAPQTQIGVGHQFCGIAVSTETSQQKAPTSVLTKTPPLKPSPLGLGFNLSVWLGLDRCSPPVLCVLWRIYQSFLKFASFIVWVPLRF